MKEKLTAILANRLVQCVFGGSLLALLTDWLNVFHTEPVLAAAGKCDSIGAAIIAIFTGGC